MPFMYRSCRCCGREERLWYPAHEVAQVVDAHEQHAARSVIYRENVSLGEIADPTRPRTEVDKDLERFLSKYQTGGMT